MLLIAAGVFMRSPQTFAQAPALPQSDSVSSSSSEDVSELTVSEVEAALANVEQDTEIAETVKVLLRSKYQEAITNLKESVSNSEKATKFREAMTLAPTIIRELREQLQDLPSPESFKEVQQSRSFDEFEQELNRNRRTLAALTEELSTVTAQISDGEQRPADISVRIPEAQRELSEIRQRFAAEDLSSEQTSTGRVADRFVLQAQQAKLLSELEMLKQEQLSMSVRRSLLQTRKDLLASQVENASVIVAAFEESMDKSVTIQAQRIAARAAKLISEFPKGHPAFELGTEVQNFAANLADAVQYKAAISAATETSKGKLKRLVQRYEGIKKQLELGQPDREMAEVLLKLRDLLDRRVSELSQEPEWPTLSQTRLAAVLVDSAIDRQSDIQTQFTEETSSTVEDVVAARGEVLSRLRDQYSELLPDLATLETEQKLYSDKVNEVHADITQQLFWMKISPTLSVKNFTEAPNGLFWVLSPNHGRELIQTLWVIIQRKPYQNAAVFLISVLLLLIKPWLRGAIVRAGAGVGRVSKDRYALTGKALLWTFLLSLPIPLLLGYAALILPQPDSSLDWLAGIRIGMRSFALSVFAAFIILAISIPGGLGQKHFKWRSEVLCWLRRSSYLFLFIYFPLIILTCCAIFSETAEHIDNIGRISFVIAHAVLFVFLRKLFYSSNGVYMANGQGNGVTLFRRLSTSLAVFCPVGLVVLAWSGYMIAALKISYLLALTLSLIVGIVILYGCALRWFKIEHRKLAFAEALERRRNRHEAAITSGNEEESDEVISVDVDEQELDIDTIDEQMRQLVQFMFGLAAATAIISLWSETLPLVEFFGSIRIPVWTELSLLDLMKAALVVAISWIAIKNLPGVLEFAVLRSTSIHAGTRNAITTIGQYVLVAIGLSLLFTVLKLDWTQFGWIAGGLSVGIGFGMQEIVANFVCGLILLFERPIRVGDVVTLEGETGTVTKIHLRATTIMNFDRGEVVLPNKTLITSKFVNWTLSSSLNRVSIPVGIAYGSDSNAARRILLEVAADHPNVSTDPAPMAIFNEFADSSLNILLRVFLPDRSNREGTISELHTEIDKRFAAAGIEIPFPQRDFHLRSGWGTASQDPIESK